MMTLLRYDVTTDPFPLQASPAKGNANIATLQVVASNPNADPVKNPVVVKGLSVTLPVGPNGDQLTADAKDVGPVAPDGWTLTATKPGDGTIEYVFTPGAGHGSVGKQGLAFTFNTVTVNSQPGTCTVTVKEGSAGNPTKQLFVTKFPNGWGAVSFWIDPPIVQSGGSTTLHWSGPSGATYSIEYYTPQTGIVNVPAQGQKALASQGEYPAQGQPPLQLEDTTTFYLTVTEIIDKQTYSAQQQRAATVATPPPQIVKFTGTIDTTGDTPVLVLKWESDFAAYCTLSNNPTEQLTTSSPTEPPPPGHRIPLTATDPLARAYTLTAFNASHQSAASTLKVQWGLLSTVPVSHYPSRLEVSPDGGTLYVVLSNTASGGGTDGDNAYIAALDTRSLQVVKTVEVENPNFIAVSRDGAKVFSTTNDTVNNLSVVDTTGWTVTNVSLPGVPVGVAVASTGPNLLYVALSYKGQVWMLDAATCRPVGQPFKVGKEPTSLAASRNGQVLCVINYNSPTISLVNTETGKVSFIRDPHLGYWFVYPRVAVAPDGARAYVACNGTNTMLVFDTATGTVVQALQCGDVKGFGAAIGLSGDGALAFVTAFDWEHPADNNGSVVVVNTETSPAAVVQTLPVQHAPSAVAASPDGLRFYVANRDSKTVSVFQATLVGGVGAD